MKAPLPRVRVALLTETLDSDETYCDLLWQAASSRAEERGCDLVVCVGRRLGAAEPDNRQHNRLFREVFDRPPSGIVVAHIVFQHAEAGRKEDFARRLEALPSVAVTAPLGQLPVVSFDDTSGLVDLLNHLIGVHGKRRIVFVAGPQAAADARVRLQVWREQMDSVGLPSGPEWVVEGDFNPLFSPELAGRVADRVRILAADAVVASSDLMAEAILGVLTDRTGRLPENLAVTGYDDIPVAGHLSPSLTTVYQPVREQFRQAMDQVLDGVCVDQEFKHSRLVLRTSCGCPDNPSSPGALDVGRQVRQSRLEIRELRTLVANLNLFAAQLNLLPDVPSLSRLLEEWLPRLGVRDFSLALSCRHDGTLDPETGDPWAEASIAGFLRWTSGRPHLPLGSPVVFESSRLAPELWWSAERRRTLLALPLVGGGRWYGVLVLEPSAEGSLISRTIQELLASFLDRDYRIRLEVRHVVEARITGELEAEKTRMLGLLLAGFSHDLATPFSVARGSVELLADGLAKLRQGFETGTLARSQLEVFFSDSNVLTELLVSNWDRAFELVERFKRVGTEVPRDDLRTTLLGPFLGDLVQSLRPLWRHRPVEVHCDIPGALEVQTRLSALVDVVTNLLQNALVHAFGPQQPGEVWLSVTLEGPECRLCVDDNGVGVPPEFRDNLFDPYVTSKEGQGGTGLGLAVVRQRAQGLLGGTASYEPREGGGSRFVIRFPRVLTG